MASSKCSACNSHSFEVVEVEPAKSNYKMFFIQCASCGSVIGVTEYYNNGVILKKQEEEIHEIKRRLNYAISLIEDMRR